MKHLLPPIVRAGWSIVSGGALGVDAMAHAAAVETGGHTTVVLGSGLLNWYPAPNFPLFDEVLARNGTIISAFRLQEQPLAKNFPARNRIISGLSRGCLLISASAKSGSRITAEFALEQGKSVFAAPGSIFDPLSEGSHALIAQGARLVSSAQDIFDEFCIEYEVPSDHGTHYQQAIADVPQQRVVMPIPVVATPQNVSPLMQALVAPSSFDELCVKTGIPFGELHAELFDLQLAGVVTQNYAGLWERVAS